MNFSKAFLSHSSKDKDLVREVSKLLAASRREFDEETFEGGRRSSEEIFKSLSRSDLFVLFASRNILDSSWVDEEIRTAQGFLGNGQLGGIIVFIIDDLNYSDLPIWLKQFVFITSSNPIRISNKIRGDLIALDLALKPSRSLFVGRAKETAEIELRLSNFEPPSFIYVGGAEGIGRRSLLRRVLSSIYR
jgi:hypothetical protein